MRPQENRAGFTLIELLIVIGIILLLVGLLAAGIIGLLSKGPELITLTEIRELETAVQNFKNTYRVFPPTRIRLYPNASDYNGADPRDAESLAYINQIWPRIGAFTNMSWNGVDTSPHDLEGDQCLVFFLGGPGGTQGFATNPTNPITAAGDRKSPFYAFQAARLVNRRGDSFFSYIDGWNRETGPQPYIYFSSGKRTNGYPLFSGAAQGGGANSITLSADASAIDNVYVNCAVVITGGPGLGQFRTIVGYSGGTKVATVASNWATAPTNLSSFAIVYECLGVTPYFEITPPSCRFLNPNSCQIISAGRDGLFGTGGLWNADQMFLQTNYPESGPAFDNQVNFWANKLGVP